MHRCIVHMDLDSFFVSVERLLDSSLIGKPVIVGGKSLRGVVSSCSYEARAFGVHSAMPMQKALKICPTAIVANNGFGSYSQYSKQVTHIIAEEAPLFEKSSIDEFYLDLSGVDKYYDSYKLATHIRNRIINETGLPISFGMATSKTTAKIATNMAKPNGQMKVNPGEERNFLAPLDIGKVPMIGKSTQASLRAMGIHTVRDIQTMTKAVFVERFGKHGASIWNKANGAGNARVIPYHERKSISQERTFTEDTYDEKKLQEIIGAMVENLAFQLRKEKKLASCVAIKIRYADFETVSRQKHIPHTVLDHQILPHVKTLFEGLYIKNRRVRLVGVRLSNLIEGGQQIDLFLDNDSSVKLYQMMDEMRKKFGSEAVRKAANVQVKNLNIENPFKGNID